MSIRDRFRYAAESVDFRKNVLEVAYPRQPDYPDNWRNMPRFLWDDAKCSLRSFFGPVTGLVLGCRETARFIGKFYEGYDRHL